MAYPETIRYLESFANYEKIPAYPYKTSLGLERVRGFLRRIGNPQDSLRCIHVAGTKGKGSTCAYITYILREAGFKAGLYTSPHLSDFRERIRILSEKRKAKSVKRDKDFEGMITKRELAGLVQQLKPEITEHNKRSPSDPLTFFELYTALAFTYFKQKKVDFAVLETGLGGRLDATNVARALVAVITPISYEHMDKLGKTIREIATEKAGIIKSQIPNPIVISAPQQSEAAQVIRKRCRKVSAKLFFAVPTKNLKPSLIGGHQKINAACAIAAMEALGRYGIKIGAGAISRGLANTRWPGRCEIISRKPLVVLDGAQNAASAKALRIAIKENFSAEGGSASGGQYEKLILILGISSDKDIEGICREICPLADIIILTQADTSRAAGVEELERVIKSQVLTSKSVKEAVKIAKGKAGTQDLILITGSLFVVGEARELML